MAAERYIAVDLGAESGRIIVSTPEALEEVYRFPNTPVTVHGNLFWDILNIFSHIKQGLKKAFQKYPNQIASIGIDTWGVDFGLLDGDGDLVGNIYHYRDKRTDDIAEEVFHRVSWKDIFAETGVQFMQINTLYQLYSFMKQKPEAFRQVRRLLTTPDLLNYWFTGVMKNEYTISTTTQLFDPKTKNWACGILEKLNIPREFFHDVTMPGTILGTLLPQISEEIDADAHVRVIAPACHDTGSAVAAIPVIQSKNYAYISSGTWSLLGIESKTPIINEHSRRYNFTNEGAADGGIRFLKNIVGLWIVQECKRQWEKEGTEYGYAELAEMAEEFGPASFTIDPNDKRFLKPGLLEDDMPLRIRQYCREQGQKIPQSPGEIVRGVLESLAECYRKNLSIVEEITGTRISEIHIIGGGSQNSLLCQLTSNACGKPVYAGPAEATALGNILLQAIGNGTVDSIEQGRQTIRKAFSIKEYAPD